MTTTSLTNGDGGGGAAAAAAGTADCDKAAGDDGYWNCSHWHCRDGGDDSDADIADFSQRFWAFLQEFRPVPTFRHAALTFGSSDSLHIAASAGAAYFMVFL